MIQTKLAASALVLCVVGCLLGGCGAGGSTYVPVIGQTGSFTISIQNANQVFAAESRQDAVGQTVNYPNAATYTVTVTETGGFTGTVHLSVQGLNGNVFDPELDSTSVTLTPSQGSVQRTLTVTPIAIGAADGQQHEFTVHGTSGGIGVDSNTAGITVGVVG